MTEDLSLIARDHQLPVEQVACAVQLLDEGNTIPFITRFRKDQTGGLDADQLRSIKKRVAELRALNERKSFVLKSIETQGALNDELAQEIREAQSSRRLEDLYLPFKAKKQSLALTAKQQGLEPLANDIFAGDQSEEIIAARAIDYVRVDRGLSNVQEVMQGVSHLIAERYSERSDLRRELRTMIWQTGQLTSKLVSAQENAPPTSTDAEKPAAESGPTGSPGVEAAANEPAKAVEGANATPESAESSASRDSQALPSQADVADGAAAALALSPSNEPADADPQQIAPTEKPAAVASAEPLPTESVSALPSSDAASAPVEPTGGTGPRRKPKKKSAENPFQDYHNFSESPKKIPHHRVLAINRGERAGMLKARIKVDYEALADRAIALLVGESHPFRELLIRCVHDALSRLILPSLEREVRRELTETAEQHAVKVFARNLRGLLLKPPVRGKRILSIDPGYKSGCAVAVLDPQGNVLKTDRIFVVGNAKRRTEHQQRFADVVRELEVDVIAIGNGAACRETEQMVSDAIRGPLADRPVKYVIVNEAGASIYSTSEIGCEELPQLPPHLRSAVSIGRRLLDPLSELVKIGPSHLGVGLYQHDIKAKHLADSLDEVVEVCVNDVGVDSNTASPALLRYVAGLNQSTARRLVEFRQTTPITNRQQLRQVSGIGDTTFVQSAGFLRVYGGDEPFDETAIHPESYTLCQNILERTGLSKEQWVNYRRLMRDNQDAARNPAPPADGDGVPSANHEAYCEALAKCDATQLAGEFRVGDLLMRDLLEALRRPTRDPRQDYAGPVFRSGIIKLEDLQPGMKLESQIVNVVDFGVFVDIGLGYSCLVHVSELSRRFVKDLFEQFSVGDALTTWVKEVDMPRRRVKLTALEPGTRREHGQRRQWRGRPVRERSSGAAAEQGTPASSTGSERPRHRSDAPDRHGNQPRGGKRQRMRRGGMQRPSYTRPAKPKPVVPITNEMIDGKKPMRSFSDLAQFFQIKKEPDDSDAPASNDAKKS